MVVGFVLASFERGDVSDAKVLTFKNNHMMNIHNDLTQFVFLKIFSMLSVPRKNGLRKYYLYSFISVKYKI